MKYKNLIGFFAMVCVGCHTQCMDPLTIQKIEGERTFKISLIAPHTALQFSEITTTYTGHNPYEDFISIAPAIGHYNQPQYNFRELVGVMQLRPEMAQATIPDSLKKELPVLDNATKVDYTISFWGPYVFSPIKPKKKVGFYTDEWYVNLVFHPWARTWAQDDSAVRFNLREQDIYFNVKVPMGIFEANGIKQVSKHGISFDTLSDQSISVHGPSGKLVTAQAAIFKEKLEAEAFLNSVAADLSNFKVLARERGGEYKTFDKINSKFALEKKVRDVIFKIPKAPQLQVIEGEDSFFVVHVTKIEKVALLPDPERLHLMFSPANAYFIVDKQRAVSSFWVAAHSPNRKYICISYVILINSHDAKSTLEEVFDSKTLGDFIARLGTAAHMFKDKDKESLEMIAKNVRTIIKGERVASMPASPSELIRALHNLEQALNQLKNRFNG